MATTKRRSRRYVLALVFGTDVATFEQYQPGTTRVPVFTEGRDYFVALRVGERAPDGFGEWQQAGTCDDWRVLIAKASAE